LVYETAYFSTDGSNKLTRITGQALAYCLSELLGTLQKRHAFDITKKGSALPSGRIGKDRIYDTFYPLRQHHKLHQKFL
jgi:hypothetical protein